MDVGKATRPKKLKRLKDLFSNQSEINLTKLLQPHIIMMFKKKPSASHLMAKVDEVSSGPELILFFSAHDLYGRRVVMRPSYFIFVFSSWKIVLEVVCY